VVGVELAGGDGEQQIWPNRSSAKGHRLIQDPDDAVDPSMPQHTLNIGHRTYSLPLTAMPFFDAFDYGSVWKTTNGHAKGRVADQGGRSQKAEDLPLNGT
jgi:hypothetical protein